MRFVITCWLVSLFKFLLSITGIFSIILGSSIFTLHFILHSAIRFSISFIILMWFNCLSMLQSWYCRLYTDDPWLEVTVLYTFWFITASSPIPPPRIPLGFVLLYGRLPLIYFHGLLFPPSFLCPFTSFSFHLSFSIFLLSPSLKASLSSSLICTSIPYIYSTGAVSHCNSGANYRLPVIGWERGGKGERKIEGEGFSSKEQMYSVFTGAWWHNCI